MMTLTHQHANRKFMRIWSDSEKLHCWAKSKFLIWLLFYNNSNFVHRAYCWNTSYHLSARSNPLFQFYLIVLRSCWHLLTHVFNHVKQMAVVSQARYHRYKGAFNFFFRTAAVQSKRVCTAAWEGNIHLGSSRSLHYTLHLSVTYRCTQQRSRISPKEACMIANIRCPVKVCAGSSYMSYIDKT